MAQTWDQLLAQIQFAGERKLRAALGALDEVAEQVLADSKELCPVSPTNEFLVDAGGKSVQRVKPIRSRVTKRMTRRIRNPLYTGTSGSLRDSGTATAAKVVGNAIVATVGYHTDYAAAVHERTQVRHGAALKAAFPGVNVPNLRGQAKFLAVPMLRMRRQFAGYIAQAVANA